MPELNARNVAFMALSVTTIVAVLTDDIEAETESLLSFDTTKIQSTVLKVAHHGSSTSSTVGFLNAVDPEAVVVSVGSKNPFGHPTDKVVGRLMRQTGVENIYRTDRHSDVEFVTNGRDLWVNTER